jgi:hypothetical protein
MTIEYDVIGEPILSGADHVIKTLSALKLVDGVAGISGN